MMSMQMTGPLLEQAFAHFQRGNLAAAEAILTGLPDHPSALHLLGVLRVRQGRVPEAADLLLRAVAMQPREAQAQFNLGKVLATLGRHGEAAEALRAALALDARLAEAEFALGKSLRALGRLDEAMQADRRCLAAKPNHVPAKLALGDALIATGRPRDAEPLLVQGLGETRDRRLAADLHQTLALARRKQGHALAALESLEQALVLDPERPGLALNRATLLEDLQRFDEARRAYGEILARAPTDVRAHHAYNDLLYRLGAEEEFLASYDRAPRTPELALAKARFLLNANRSDEAETCYRDILRHDASSREAALGVGLALVKKDQFMPAIAAFEDAARRWPDSAEIHCNLSGALAQLGDPQKAGTIAEKALGLEPGNQVALAMQGTSWRMMADERDEALNGYDEFIQVFDLEPPAGYSDMAAFNAELTAHLDTLHPRVREYLGQSLRGGTQTSENLFGAGHALVEKLRARIGQAVDRYIAGLRSDERHPLLSRRRRDFAFSGSWSSRLRDCGFHINHLHPGGWISSCYYVDLPEAVKDEAGRQGWIKFGEPSFDVGLGVRRAIQPAAGRLVLFPSYMWHGTVPFHDHHARTTIAFDVVPA